MRICESSRVRPAFRRFVSAVLAIGAVVALGVSARADDPPPGLKLPDLDWSAWTLHAQTTVVSQGNSKFRSPYSGQNSLYGGGQSRETWTGTAFIGRSLWTGAEIYLNPEFNQGHGLSNTLGLGGFPSGEAQQIGARLPVLHLHRAYLQQTFGLGGEQETIKDDVNQVAGKKDVSRLTVTAGKFSVMDFFDNNAYAHDPRAGFMNWAVWAPGAFDFAADQFGYTFGAMAELNQPNFAIRLGYFLVPSSSNTGTFDFDVLNRGSAVLEFEQRFSLFSQPGKLRVISWLNRSLAGSHTEILKHPEFNLDIRQTRQTRSQYGFALNLEQTLNDDLGVFSRFSWNNGQNEVISFTDIDRSLSFGGVLKGTRWGRPDDKIGLAGAVNALSDPHRAYIAAGGMGIIIGDGRLNYRTEKIMEAYYAIALPRSVTMTLDYQFIVDPAYNADRGPVSVYAVRLHVDF